MTTYYLDNLHDTNGTAIAGGHVADTGQTYSNLSIVTPEAGVIEGNAAYSGTGTGHQNCFLTPSFTPAVNDPFSLTFTYNGSPGNQGLGIGVFLQSNGTHAELVLNLSTLALTMYNVSTIGGYTAISPSVAITGGLTSSVSYTMFLVPWGLTLTAYFQRNSDSLWYGMSGWQANKTPALSIGYTTYTTTLGVVYLLQYEASASNAPAVTKFQGGPGLMLPPDLGCKRSFYNFNRLVILPVEGGTAPISFALQRSPHGAATWTTIANPVINPSNQLAQYLDQNVSASTAYDYQVIATDSASSPLVLTSPTVTVTTPASQVVTPYTPVVPASPATSFIAGTAGLDTAGTLLQIHEGNGFWDDAYETFFFLGADITATEGGSASMRHGHVYTAVDQLNWTNQGVGITNTINGTSYTGLVYRPKLIAHPRDGMYYTMVVVNTGSLFTFLANVCMFQSGATPTTCTTYVSSLTGTDGSCGDSCLFVDYDGSVLFVTNDKFSANGASGGVQTFLLNSTLTSGTLLSTMTGTDSPGPFRYGRMLAMVYGGGGGGGWSDTTCNIGIYGVNAGVGATLTAAPNILSTASLCTTPSQAIAAPVGITNGYLGSEVGITSSSSSAYWSQSGSVLSTLAGYSAYNDRYGTVQGSFNGTYPCSMVLYQIVPASEVSFSTPLIADNTTGFVPPCGVYAVTLSANSVAVGSPVTITTTPYGAATDTLTWSDGGKGGTFSSTTQTFSGSATPATITYTPAVGGAITLTTTSAYGYFPLGAPLALTSLSTPIPINFNGGYDTGFQGGIDS